MKQINCEELIQINKAVLTPKAIQCLEKLQAQENFGLDAIYFELGNAICFLGRCITLLDNEHREHVVNIIAALSQVQNTIEDFQKPVMKN